MGFRFRKSFGTGPFKVTMSKSGIGYSVGGKGFRVTKKASGGTRTTVGIPGTGISYSTDSKKKKSSGRSKAQSGRGFGAIVKGFLYFIGICLIVGLIQEYWKILLALVILAAAAFIAFTVYRRNKQPSESDPELSSAPELYGADGIDVSDPDTLQKEM